MFVYLPAQSFGNQLDTLNTSSYTLPAHTPLQSISCQDSRSIMEGPNSSGLCSSLASASTSDSASSKIALVLEARIPDVLPEGNVLEGVEEEFFKEVEGWVKRELLDLNKALLCIIDTDILPLMNCRLSSPTLTMETYHG
jgi:hypothetical protein